MRRSVLRLPNMMGVCVGLFGLTGGAWPQDRPEVRITGGADASGHLYTWRIENRADRPIAHVAFPHYHADLFHSPPGWRQNCTFLVNEGVPDRPGICEAYAPPEGLAPGSSAAFSMRIAVAGAVRGKGVVTITFTDGGVINVDGVELPRAPSGVERFVPLIAFGAVLALILIRRWMRQALSRKHPEKNNAEAAG